MKKVLSVLVCLILSGCIAPKFNDDTQEIFLWSQPETKLTIGEYGKVDSSKIEIKRSSEPLKVILSKTGFESKEIQVKSHFTDDTWAAEYVPASAGHPISEKSSLFLLPPMRTVGLTLEWGGKGAVAPVGQYGWKGIFVSPLSMFAGAIGGFIVGLGDDIKNLITLSFPRVVIMNPWYKYDNMIDLTKEILTPTAEFKKECYSKKNTFIGNNDCLTCLTEKEVVSTGEECNRCSNREWSNFECRLK